MKSLGLTAAVILLLSSGAQAATYVSLGGLGGGLGGYPAPAPVAAPVPAPAPAASPPPAQNTQTQNLSNLMNNQGAPYGQKGKGDQSGSSTAKVTYHYRVPNPNDPLQVVPVPQRLYGDQLHVYYNDNCICTAGPY